MKRMGLLSVCLLVLTTAIRAEDPAPERSFSAGLFAAVRDDYDPGVGFGLTRALGDRMRMWFSIESAQFDESTSYGDDDYYSSTLLDVDGYEFQIGYLHRLDTASGAWSLWLGPSIGLEELEGEYITRFGGDFGSGGDRTDFDYELGVNAYLNLMILAQASERVQCFVSASLGYRGGREVEMGGGAVPLAAESAGDAAVSRRYFPTSDGADSFLRLAAGVLASF